MRSLIINYKAYNEGIDRCTEIAEISGDVAKKLRVRIIVAPPFSRLRETAGICESIAQGMDPIEPGAFTGHISWYEIKKSGATGVLINHSENRMGFDEIKLAVDICKKNGLQSYVCAGNLYEATKITEYSPYAVAYEPPELIGGNISVSKSKPEVVKEFCDMVKKHGGVLPLIGAGIKTAEDVKKSVELGSEGILVASGIMKSESVKDAIVELAEPLA